MSNEYPPAPPPPPPPAGPPPAGPPAGAYAPQPPLSPSDQRLWATLVHIGGIFFSFVPPLVAYLVLKDRGEFIREHTKTALNFQITLVIGYLVVGVITVVTFGIGSILYLAVWAIGIVFAIIAAMAANRGEAYVYPKWCAIPFIK